MKFLKMYQVFRLDDFLKGKELTVKGCGPWKDFETKVEKGTRIEVVITKDDTPYPVEKSEKKQTNLYELISIRVAKINFFVEPGTVVTPVNGKGAVYGEYRNQLSIVADDVTIIRGGKDG